MFRWFQVFGCRACNYLPKRVESGIVAWAIPGAFYVVPAHHTTQVRTNSGTLMPYAILIAVHSNFSSTSPHDLTCTSHHFRWIAHFTTCQVMLKLRGHIHI